MPSTFGMPTLSATHGAATIHEPSLACVPNTPCNQVEIKRSALCSRDPPKSTVHHFPQNLRRRTVPSLLCPSINAPPLRHILFSVGEHTGEEARAGSTPMCRRRSRGGAARSGEEREMGVSRGGLPSANTTCPGGAPALRELKLEPRRGRALAPLCSRQDTLGDPGSASRSADMSPAANTLLARPLPNRRGEGHRHRASAWPCPEGC
jgi:hypothetical protein